MATQQTRRADTRVRLLAAAAELFAERGVDSTSIGAIAELADRTSGAVYDHFGGKDGVLVALLDSWVVDLSAVIGAELATATTLEERLAVLWRNVSAPAVGDGRWIALELELWTHASRDPAAREHLARRYRGAWRGIVELADASNDVSPDVGPAVIGLLFGLEMMRRVDPVAVTDRLAIDSLTALVQRHRSDATTR
ncbi:MAG TPA: TetR/AcrR family transcriptional regulator [Microthrixaceae bacterium]|jgi:AcrR family transcriptional regulator|nr:TetR/AcrR family transcriptional regulator [Microthrixaceae bacterium]HQF92754.1 TetR/AcrR family transcriptional regulator [Microthrixaceae bacterium]